MNLDSLEEYSEYKAVVLFLEENGYVPCENFDRERPVFSKTLVNNKDKYLHIMLNIRYSHVYRYVRFFLDISSKLNLNPFVLETEVHDSEDIDNNNFIEKVKPQFEKSEKIAEIISNSICNYDNGCYSKSVVKYSNIEKPIYTFRCIRCKQQIFALFSLHEVLSLYQTIDPIDFNLFEVIEEHEKEHRQ